MQNRAYLLQRIDAAFHFTKSLPQTRCPTLLENQTVTELNGLAKQLLEDSLGLIG